MKEHKLKGGAKISGTGFYTPPGGGAPVPFNIEGETDLSPAELEKRLGVPVTVVPAEQSEKGKDNGNA